MTYFFALIGLSALFIAISSFIKLPAIQEGNVFNFFVKQIIVITVVISVFAVAITHGKSIFILFLLSFLYLVIKKHIQFSIPKRINKKNIFYLALLLPVISIQFFLNFDLPTLTPYLPSSDILSYSSFANTIVEFGNENKYEALNILYPELFKGISPYHYYEIWFTGLIGFFSGASYVSILLFIVYPYFVWLLLLGICSLFEHYGKLFSYKHYFLCFLLLFTGPVYFSIYESVFHDGDFFNSTIFTVPGFVKQTLPFSYYGQKHLPVYLFVILSFLFLLKKRYSLAIFSGLMTTICSFGTLPGLFGAFGLLFLIKKEIRTKQNFTIIAIAGISIILIISLFKMEINSEISQKTFYFGDFLKYLNFKGEILRIVSKIVAPLIWFSILYFPFIVLIFINRKSVFTNLQLKWLLLLSGLLFISGALFISLVQGMNSDQFLTNLLPIFNIVMIILLIHLYAVIAQKKIIIGMIISVFIINLSFSYSFHEIFQKPIKSLYTTSVIEKVKKQLKMEASSPIIACLLSDSIVENKAPIIWYTDKPGKLFCLSNYFNFVNINYPYTEYPRNTSSIAFSPDNQMRFFMKNKIVSKDDFEQYQLSFLKTHSIKWLFCHKDVIISPEIDKIIEKTFHDPLSGETYYRLKD